MLQNLSSSFPPGHQDLFVKIILITFYLIYT